MKLVCSYLIKEKKKSIILILTVILMISSMVCIGNLLYGIQNCQMEYVKSTKGYYEYSFVAEGRNKTSILESEHTGYQIGALQYITNTENPVPIQLMACDRQFLEMNHIGLQKGSMPSNSREIVIEEWVLNNLGENITVGDEFTFENNRYTISGVLTDSYFKSLEEMNAFTTFINDEECEFYVLFDTKKDLAEQIEAMANKYNLDKSRISANWDVLESEGTKAPIGENNDNLLGYIKNISVNVYTVTNLWGCLAVFMIYSIYYLSFFKREKDYGILKALGCSKGQFFFIIFSELFILFIIGILPGYFVGNWVTSKIYHRIMKIFLVDCISIVGFQENINILTLGCIVIVVLFFVIAFFTSQHISNSKSIDLLRKKERALLKNRKIRSKSRHCIIYDIAYRFVTIRKALLILIVISLSIGNIFFVTAQYVLEQVREQKILEIKSGSGLGADYRICVENTDLNQGISENKLDDIKKTSGITDIHAFKYMLGAVFLEDNMYPNKQYFKPENENERFKNMTGGICTKQADGRYLLRTNLWGYDKKTVESLSEYLIEGELDYQDIAENKKVIVRLSMSGSGQYDNVKIKPGDKIKIMIPKMEHYSETNILKFKNNDFYYIAEVDVAATVKSIPTRNKYFIDNSGIDIVMTNEMFTQQTKVSDYNQVEMIKSKNGDIAEINAELSTIVSQMKSVSFVNHTMDIERAKANYHQQLLIFSLMSVAIVLMGFLYIVNCSRYLIYAWKREIALLRTIGMADMVLYKMMILEAFIYSFFSFIITGALSIICIGGIYLFLKKVCFFYNVGFEIDGYLLGGIGISNFTICLFIMIITARNLLQLKQLEIINKG